MKTYERDLLQPSTRESNGIGGMQLTRNFDCGQFTGENVNEALEEIGNKAPGQKNKRNEQVQIWSRYIKHMPIMLNRIENKRTKGKLVA